MWVKAGGREEEGDKSECNDREVNRAFKVGLVLEGGCSLMEE